MLHQQQNATELLVALVKISSIIIIIILITEAKQNDLPCMGMGGLNN